MTDKPETPVLDRLRAKKPRRAAFVDHYAKLGVGTDAVIAAGFTTKNPKYRASMLLKDTEIRAALDEMNRVLEANRVADALEIQQFLTRVMRGKTDKGEWLTEDQLDRYGNIVKTRVPYAQRIRAAETLARLKGLFTVGAVESTSELDAIAQALQGATGDRPLN